MSAGVIKSGMQASPGVRPSPSLHLIGWRDILVVVDHGAAGPDDYARVEVRINELTVENPRGVGVLTIVPPNAVPPTDEARRAIKSGLGRVGHKIRCTCWLVEGRGFRAATVRAALAGLRLFLRTSHPSHVADSLEASIRWMSSQLGPSCDADVREAARIIQRQRESIVESI
jgi:hypothetical protein